MRYLMISLLIVSFAIAVQAQDSERFVSVPAGEVPGLVLKVPAKTVVTPIKGKTVIHTKDMFLHIWAVNNASNVTEGVSRVADVIKGDVLNFKPTATNDMTLAQMAAKQLIGPGTEADDGDEGNAEVIVFTIGGRVFVACIHGEGPIDPKEHKAMLGVLQSVKAP